MKLLAAQKTIFATAAGPRLRCFLGGAVAGTNECHVLKGHDFSRAAGSR
jgi:hypothetical protein